jgi:hypothetical protein
MGAAWEWHGICELAFTLTNGPQYPLYRRLGGPPCLSGWVLKISPLSGFEPQTIQPIACCCNNYAIPALMLWEHGLYIKHLLSFGGYIYMLCIFTVALFDGC